MPHPPKIDKICEKLRRHIKRNCLPGDKLLSERKLSAKLKISSRTLGIAMRKLVAEKLIIRNKQGSFVCPTFQTDLSNPKDIYILLPSSDFYYSGGVCWQRTHQQMIDISREIILPKGGNVITIPVTEHNAKEEIDQSILANLPDGSNIMFSSPWYEKLFPLFGKKKFRIGFLNAANPNLLEIFNANDVILINYGSALYHICRDVINYFIKKECRNILVAFDENNYIYPFFKDQFPQYLAEHNIQGDMIAIHKGCTGTIYVEKIKKAWQSGSYDAMFFVPPEQSFNKLKKDFYEYTGIPHSVPVMMYECNPVKQPMLKKYAKRIIINTPEYLTEIVNFLISGQHEQVYKKAENKITNFSD